MGQSTNAIIFFGICLDQETYRPYEDPLDEEWEVRYARLMGVRKPEKPYPERPYSQRAAPNYTDDEKAIIDHYSAYFEAKHDVVRKSPVQMDTHCSGDCPMPFLYIEGTRLLAHRGFPQKIDPINLMVNQDTMNIWNEQIIEFAQKMGIDIKGCVSGWYLVSDWN
jgi:hypothetical protein